MVVGDDLAGTDQVAVVAEHRLGSFKQSNST